MINYQPIYDIAALCAAKGIRDVVLCPGSRSAPLTLAFTRHSQLKTRTFSDERSAAFIALGVAQSTRRPVVLVCTSGSAAYNFAPAVAEAFFNHVPLVVFTADRPAEWIGQLDGQTIFQPEIFGKHVKASYQLPQDYDHRDSLWAINRITNEAINVAHDYQLPVHVNAPFREPLYPAKNQAFSFSEKIRVIESGPLMHTVTREQQIMIADGIKRYNKVLVVAGQQEPDAKLNEVVQEATSRLSLPLVADIISNVHDTGAAIEHTDLFLGQASDDVKRTLAPDLVITFGKSLISKNLKLFLRKYTATEHWHIAENPEVADPYQSITHIIRTTPLAFFQLLASLPVAETFEQQKQKNYAKLWEVEERRSTRVLENFFPKEQLGALETLSMIMHELPAHAQLHLANSMSVRYANIIGLFAGQRNICVYANRGTSGIDGCSSTAVGHSLASEAPNFLFTGDIAFFYDRNAFWHNYPLPNLRVVIINDHGGGIFNMIDGPASQPEAGEYFITEQKLDARKLCEEFGFDYLRLDSRKKLRNYIKDFLDFDGKTKILELQTDVHTNRTIFDDLKLKMKSSYEL